MLLNHFHYLNTLLVILYTYRWSFLGFQNHPRYLNKEEFLKYLKGNSHIRKNNNFSYFMPDSYLIRQMCKNPSSQCLQDKWCTNFSCTPSWKKVLDENWSTELYHISFFKIFHVELEYVIFEMIHWANLKGRQF